MQALCSDAFLKAFLEDVMPEKSAATSGCGPCIDVYSLVCTNACLPFMCVRVCVCVDIQIHIHAKRRVVYYTYIDTSARDLHMHIDVSV